MAIWFYLDLSTLHVNCCDRKCFCVCVFLQPRNEAIDSVYVGLNKGMKDESLILGHYSD